MVFNAVFTSILVTSRWPVHLSNPCFSGVLLTSNLQNILSKPLAAYPHNQSKQWTAVRVYWILSQWPSSILRKNIGRAVDRTSDLFSIPQCYRLSYRTRQLLFFLYATWAGKKYIVSLFATRTGKKYKVKTYTPPSTCGPTFSYILISRLQLYTNTPSWDRCSILIPNIRFKTFGSFKDLKWEDSLEDLVLSLIQFLFVTSQNRFN